MVSIEPGNREGPPGSLTGSPRDIVVIGASRGGIEAIRGIVAALPPNLQSTLLIVVHISPTHASLLPDVLKLPRFRGVLASLVDYASVGWTSIACS